ncbi:MAG: response regulator, partial [Nitrospirae bacterium]|nr:response regulator [Nitrospirota bacterium]
VRDLSRDRGKELELVIEGAEIEIDRRILEEIKDPLIHLVRNSIDHGIEKPAERGQKRKSPRGTVAIAISQKDGSKVEILITDDGAGIDAAKVRSAAQKLNLISPEEAERLGDRETMGLIFQSGLSTSPIITDLSGRGLGLAIVREKVEKLGGLVTVETRPDAGTTFRMILPITLATFRGLLVRVHDHLFAIRTTHLELVGRVNKEEIKTVENRETIRLNGRAVSLVRLGDLLELPGKGTPGDSPDDLQFVILSLAEKRMAFLVDEILSEQEVLVKSLGPQLSRVRNVAGATILGTGKVVPILNVHDLLKSAVKNASVPVKVPATVEAGKQKGKTILVAEDSITARTLLKNILETAGYRVKTAVDGVEAFTALRTEAFDLAVSDVDMPRMNGFDLTAKVRADKKLSDLPVVLVTALESREDRERGIDVGANAYIVKSSFDQSNLLEVIRRLV